MTEINFTILIGEEKYWGRGIGKEVAKKVINIAAQEGTETISSRALEPNTARNFTEQNPTPYKASVKWRNFSKQLD